MIGLTNKRTEITTLYIHIDDKSPTNSCARIEDDLSSVYPVHHPVLRMVSSITDIYSNLSVDCLEHSMTSVALKFDNVKALLQRMRLHRRLYGISNICFL